MPCPFIFSLIGVMLLPVRLRPAQVMCARPRRALLFSAVQAGVVLCGDMYKSAGVISVRRSAGSREYRINTSW